MNHGRPSVIYVSYDGASELLGRSQVVPYLERLASTADITLISFEKGSSKDQETARRLEQAGVHWRPLRYHRNPPVMSTAWDIHRGSDAIDAAAAERQPHIIHARSYVPALMTLRSRAERRAGFLFDIRGFWADERVDGGIWRRGLLYRLAKRYEADFFRRADAIVTLTEASVPRIEEWTEGREMPIAVIPTCAAVDAGSTPRSDGPIAVWNGSISTWYDFDLAVRIARELGFGLKVLTREAELARAKLNGYPADVRTVPQHCVADELAPGDVGLCLVRPSFSKLASDQAAGTLADEGLSGRRCRTGVSTP